MTEISPSSHLSPGQLPEMPKAYKPAEHEGRVWDRWIAAGAFRADPARVLTGQAQPYCIVIPPPNVTAQLHLGHALNNTIQDILTRWHRMRGFEALWMPGTDHAGIATQAVVEKRVSKEEKKRRTDFTREAFIAKIQAFKDEYEAIITNQLKKMGCSCDWDRQRFTMDEVCARAVREAFFRLFRDGLIYRGKRLVNWDPALQTAVADDECLDKEFETSFWYLRYPLTEPARLPDGTVIDHVTVATTRPETYLGDTAVALNPADPRAAALVGKRVRLPIIGREIPIIADSYVVLPKAMARTEEEANDPKAEFATGFLKVTPAHDANDWEIGRRHNLPAVNMMSPDGRVSEKYGLDDVGEAKMFLGLKMEDARKAVVKEFEARGLLEATKPYRQTKSISDRSGAIIEPYLSDQWYVKVTDPRMAPAANEALRAGELTFHPERYAKTYEQWHDGIRDWCISRQLWWGHRIPVWTGAGALPAGVSAAISRGDASSAQASEGRTHVCLRREDAALAAELEKAGFVQDPDVLDTWFSSALWPMSTMGWPEPDKAAEIEGDPSLRDLLRAFNPTSVLCTAREIITLWVSRMVMFNHVFLGKDGRKGPVPFRDVFIHAVIQDGEGRKMSKSLGNGVDPLDIIATHGSDAMRFTLCHMATDTQDVRLPVMKDSATGANTSPKFDLGRNFCNKLWNAARFAMQNLRADDGEAPIDPAKLSLVDHWMLSRLTQGLADAEKALSEYRFSDYAQAVYDLMWRDFCDWYLEIVKPTVGEDRGQRAVLRAALDTIVRLLHPVAPYVTEVIWERLSTYPQPAIPGLTLSPARKGGTLCTAGWPEFAPTLRNEHAEAQFEDLRTLVTGIREVRAQHNVPPKRKVSLHGPGGEIKKLMIFPGIVETLGGLGKANNTMPDDSTPHVAFTVGGVEFRLSDLADAVDAGADRARLEKQIADLAKSIATLEGRLANPGYTDRAPPAMVQQTRDQLAKAQAERDAAQKALARLGT